MAAARMNRSLTTVRWKVVQRIAASRSLWRNPQADEGLGGQSGLIHTGSPACRIHVGSREVKDGQLALAFLVDAQKVRHPAIFTRAFLSRRRGGCSRWPWLLR